MRKPEDDAEVLIPAQGVRSYHFVWSPDSGVGYWVESFMVIPVMIGNERLSGQIKETGQRDCRGSLFAISLCLGRARQEILSANQRRVSGFFVGPFWLLQQRRVWL